MTSCIETRLPGAIEAQPAWTNPDLPPDQVLYERLGPWSQPAPAYPIRRPPEVLTIPPVEAALWNETIGSPAARPGLLPSIPLGSARKRH